MTHNINIPGLVYQSYGLPKLVEEVRALKEQMIQMNQQLLEIKLILTKTTNSQTPPLGRFSYDRRLPSQPPSQTSLDFLDLDFIEPSNQHDNT